MEETAVQSPGFFDPTLFLLIGMLAIVYFMLIRPQNKRAKELQQMLSALEKGDEVVAASVQVITFLLHNGSVDFRKHRPGKARRRVARKSDIE